MAKRKSDKVKPLPCPFCGSIPKVERINRVFRGEHLGDGVYVTVVQTRVKINCSDCFLHKDVSVESCIDDENADDKTVNKVAHEKAKAIIENFWNKRVKNA